MNYNNKFENDFKKIQNNEIDFNIFIDLYEPFPNTKYYFITKDGYLDTLLSGILIGVVRKKRGISLTDDIVSLILWLKIVTNKKEVLRCQEYLIENQEDYEELFTTLYEIMFYDQNIMRNVDFYKLPAIIARVYFKHWVPYKQRKNYF